MRRALFVIGLLVTLSTAQAQSTTPLGPVSRDLLYTKLTDVQKSLDGLKAGEAREKMEHLAAMLEVDAYYAGTSMPNQIRKILTRLKQDDLATASAEFENLFQSLDHLPSDYLGTI